tara:strand:+ start:7194 stop:7628 length:435 start_codon:yes stop_codon:yes gene_type:complete
MNFLIVIATFILMEFVAWIVHKYIMHGFLWILHKDHHVVDKNKVLQKNDYFFLIFAIPSMLLIFIGYPSFSYKFFIGIGIALYGLAYFIVHEIIIHRRLPPPAHTKSKYIKAIRKAHHIHHKNKGKHHSVNFGMLIVPWKYFKE